MSAAETYSIVLVLLTAVAAGLVGSFALMKRMSLAGDVVSHIALPGLGIAFLLKINPMLGAAGVNVSRLNLYFLMVFSLTVLLGLRFLGALLVGALIIVPAAIGRQLTHTLNAFLLTSSLASVLSVALGFTLSRFYPHITIAHVTLNLALGPAIIAVATVLFLLSLLRKKI